MDTEQFLALVRAAVRAELEERPTTLKFNQAAEALNVSPRHIGRMVRRGSLMTVDIDGARRIPMSEIRRVASLPSLPSSGATPEQVRFDAAAALRRLDELRKKKKPKKPTR